MHTRRVGAFLIGAWLLGTLLAAFIAGQSYTNVERFFTNPPTQVSKEIDDFGPETMRQVLRFQASQHVRHVYETWEVIQLGLAGALLATSFLTSHRSRIVLSATALMAVMVLVMYFYLTPLMNTLSRSYDFLPAGTAVQERESYNHYAIWYRVLDILKTILALVIAGRLLFDRYDWQEKLLPGGSPAGAKGARRRRRSVPQGSSSEPASPAANPQMTSPASDTPIQHD